MPYQKWNQREEAALERGVQKHGEGNWLEILKAPLPSQRRPVRLRHALSLVVQDPEFAVLRERNLTNVQLKDKYRLRTRSATPKTPKTASSKAGSGTPSRQLRLTEMRGAFVEHAPTYDGLGAHQRATPVTAATVDPPMELMQHSQAGIDPQGPLIALVASLSIRYGDHTPEASASGCSGNGSASASASGTHAHCRLLSPTVTVGPSICSGPTTSSPGAASSAASDVSLLSEAELDAEEAAEMEECALARCSAGSGGGQRSPVAGGGAGGRTEGSAWEEARLRGTAVGEGGSLTDADEGESGAGAHMGPQAGVSGSPVGSGPVESGSPLLPFEDAAFVELAKCFEASTRTGTPTLWFSRMPGRHPLDCRER